MSTLRGSLQSISHMDVVQMLNVNRKTGKLQVTQGAMSGVLYVLNGDVTHAETPGAQGESAAFDILEWDKGEFEFITTKFKAPVTIKRRAHDLLMEAARTMDSRKHLRGIFPSLHSVPWPTLAEPGLTAGLKLFTEDRRVLPFLDGYRTFLEVMAVSEQSEVSVLQICAALKDAGRLALLEPGVTLTVETLRPRLFQRSGPLELPKALEARWSAQGPAGAAPPAKLRVIWPEGLAVAPVQFVKGREQNTIGIPKELMQSWELHEGTTVTVRPAP
jgi:hypothetical protein